MITEIRKVPVTEETRPFATALKVCPLEELGYAEEEYFQSGTATYTGRKKKFLLCKSQTLPIPPGFSSGVPKTPRNSAEMWLSKSSTPPP